MTRIVLDLDELVAEGKLSTVEAARLTELQAPGGRLSLMVNILLIFGSIAVAMGVLALNPTPTTGLVLALGAIGGAAALRYMAGENWQVLSQGLALMGTLGLSGWIAAEMWEAESAFWPPFLIFALTSGMAIWFRNAFLAALGVLAFGALLGSGTVYWYASYGLFVREPLLTVIAFTAIAAGAYHARNLLPLAWQTLTTVAARTAVIMVNFGFWVGSLFGDHVGEHWVAADNWRATRAWREEAFQIPEPVFIIGWALALAACIFLPRRGGFLSISAIVFFCIHVYTQYFELFGADAVSLIIAGAMAIAIAVFGGRHLVQQAKAAS